jgi:voltage-gated sodium channel
MISRLLLNERFILLVIFLNSLVIFLEGFSPSAPISIYLDVLDNIFTVVFIAEMIVKLRSWGRVTYFASAWNTFDFILVLIALPALISSFLPGNFIDLGFLLAFRTLRVFKFFRFIRFVPHIDKIIRGSIRAAKASIVILFSFFIFNFTMSLLTCFIFRSISPEHFENPLISLYSIFKVFTVEGWYEIPDLIAENSDSPLLGLLTRIYFVVILFVGGIFGLSLVNSIFVDALISETNDEIEDKLTVLERKIDALISASEKK